MLKRFALCSLALALVHCQTPPTKIVEAMPTYKTAAEIPVEQFFRNPTLVAVRISPDGKNVLSLKSWKNRLNVFITPIAEPSTSKQITFVEDRDIGDAHWKNAGTVLFSKDLGGDENYHVFTASIKTGVVKDLTPFPGSRSEILDLLEDSSPTDILLTNNRRDKEVFDVYRINTETGVSKMVVENKNKIGEWRADHYGNVCAGSL